MQQRNSELATVVLCGVPGVICTGLLWLGTFVVIRFLTVIYKDFLPEIPPAGAGLAAALFVYLVFHAERKDFVYQPLALPGFDTGTVSDKVVVYSSQTGIASNVNPLGPRTVTSIARCLSRIFTIGPHLIRLSLMALSRARRISRLRFTPCAEICAHLLQAGGRVSFVDLQKEFPTAGPEGIYADLAYLDGILFLDSDPPGITLSTRLRNRLSGS